MIPVFSPSLGREEEKAVSKVLKSGWIGSGPAVARFEKDFLTFTKGKYAVATNSASAALHLAIIAAGVGKGDEVITPSFTFVATNHPILMQGATPVFCDIKEDNFCADPRDIERKITGKTRAVVVVHYGGYPAQIEEIVKICKKNNLILIEDCAHASGSFYKGRHLGTFGDFGCFSFAAIKNLTTGDGGMLIGKSKEKIDQARTLSWSGISQSTWERAKKGVVRWRYNVVSAGWKYQMNDIAASIGIVQLVKLKKNNGKRKDITNRYDKAFKGVPWIKVRDVGKDEEPSYHNYIIRVSAQVRDKLSDFLAVRAIATSVHYVPSHHYKIYSKYKSKLPVTDKIWKEILLLPIFPDLRPIDQKHIIDSILKFKP